MATVTLGSAANNTLTALLMSNGMSDADVATIVAALKGDPGNPNSPIGSGYLMPGAWNHAGILSVPGRGVLIAQPGDYVAVGPVSGWPILISRAAAATADFVHT